MTGRRIQAGCSLKGSAPQVANAAPMYNCPSPPTLIKPTREGKATASAVISMGIMATSTSENP